MGGPPPGPDHGDRLPRRPESARRRRGDAHEPPEDERALRPVPERGASGRRRPARGLQLLGARRRFPRPHVPVEGRRRRAGRPSRLRRKRRPLRGPLPRARAARSRRRAFRGRLRLRRVTRSRWRAGRCAACPIRDGRGAPPTTTPRRASSRRPRRKTPASCRERRARTPARSSAVSSIPRTSRPCAGRPPSRSARKPARESSRASTGSASSGRARTATIAARGGELANLMAFTLRDRARRRPARGRRRGEPHADARGPRVRRECVPREPRHARRLPAGRPPPPRAGDRGARPAAEGVPACSPTSRACPTA